MSDIVSQNLSGIQKLQLRRLLLKVVMCWTIHYSCFSFDAMGYVGNETDLIKVTFDGPKPFKKNENMQ